MMTPVGRLVLLRSFPREQLITAMTYMTFPAIIGPVVGPIVGGALTTYASWRWAFFINIPFALLGAALALRFVGGGSAETPRRFDIPGFLLVGLGVALLQFSFEMSRSAASLIWIAAAAAAAFGLLALYLRHARRAPAPAVDLELFGDRAFRVGTLAGGLCRVGMNATPFLLPLMLQIGFGVTPLNSGLLTFAGSMGGLVIRPMLSRLLRLFGFGRVLIGSAVAGAGVTAGFALIGAGASRPAISAYIMLFGVVRAVQFMASNTLSYADLPPEKLSGATSVGGMLQQLSISFGVSIGAMTLGVFAGPRHLLTPQHFHQTFLALAALPLLSIPGFFALRPQDGAKVSRHVPA